MEVWMSMDIASRFMVLWSRGQWLGQILSRFINRSCMVSIAGLWATPLRLLEAGAVLGTLVTLLPFKGSTPRVAGALSRVGAWSAVSAGAVLGTLVTLLPWIPNDMP